MSRSMEPVLTIAHLEEAIAEIERISDPVLLAVQNAREVVVRSVEVWRHERAATLFRHCEVRQSAYMPEGQACVLGVAPSPDARRRLRLSMIINLGTNVVHVIYPSEPA